MGMKKNTMRFVLDEPNPRKPKEYPRIRRIVSDPAIGVFDYDKYYKALKEE